MFSMKKLHDNSRVIAVITKGGSAKAAVYFTEKTRGLKGSTKDFVEEMRSSGYLEDYKNGYITLKDDYRYEVVPSEVTTQFPRACNYYISSSNSGKSYRIAKWIKRYHELHPKNMVIYLSANPLSNDKNYEGMDFISEVDMMKLDTIIDFTTLKDCVVVFDDCDSQVATTLTDVDERLTEENIKQLTVVERQKAQRMLDKKMESISAYINESIKSLLFCGRKNNISVIQVSHKMFDGINQTRFIDEATGIILFPNSMRKQIVSRFLQEKLDFDKADAQELTALDWYQYDQLFISHKGTQFIIADDRIKVFE